MTNIMLQISQYAIPFIFLTIPVYGLIKKVNVYETFVVGAEEGMKVAIKIFPFLLGMLVAINLFRESGALDGLCSLLNPVMSILGVPAEVLPLALMRPLSGNGSLAITTDLLTTYGVDSQIGFLASIMQGGTDTTFYVLTVYFGSIGVIKYRHALVVGLFADFVSFVTANAICSIFFI